MPAGQCLRPGGRAGKSKGPATASSCARQYRPRRAKHCRMMDIDLDPNRIRLVRFLYADHGGIIRGKSAGATRLRERVASGIGHTVAMMAMSMLDHLQPVDGMGPVGEVRIVPDPRTYVDLPYAPGAGAMLADLVLPDGTPWEACPRTFLKRATAAMAAEGYGVQAAFEPEFTLGIRESSPGG